MPYAFLRHYGYEVNALLYERHRSHPYLMNLLADDKYAPEVEIHLVNSLDPTFRVSSFMKVSLRAAMSRLCCATSKDLGMNRGISSGSLVSSPDIVSGRHVIYGIEKRVTVFLGGAEETVPVIVPLDDAAIDSILDDRRKYPDVEFRFPDRDILGVRGILQRYLLCFDAQMLYAFHVKASKKNATSTW